MALDAAQFKIAGISSIVERIEEASGGEITRLAKDMLAVRAVWSIITLSDNRFRIPSSYCNSSRKRVFPILVLHTRLFQSLCTVSPGVSFLTSPYIGPHSMPCVSSLS